LPDFDMFNPASETGCFMDENQLDALAKRMAKNLKTPDDLCQYGRLLKKRFCRINGNSLAKRSLPVFQTDNRTALLGTDCPQPDAYTAPCVSYGEAQYRQGWSVPDGTT
jgi:hypothetical protein